MYIYGRKENRKGSSLIRDAHLEGEEKRQVRITGRERERVGRLTDILDTTRWKQ